MWDDIPSELLDKILCRVPADSLLRFRSVCKSWRRLVDDPAFINSHITQQLSSPNPAHLLIRNQTGGRLFSLPLHSLNFDYGNQTIEATPVKNLILPGVPRIPTLPVASCNGLILISHYDVNKIWVLWNLLTKECYELPELDFADLRLIGCGLGYDSVDDDYKVVRIDEMYLNRKFVYKTLIYSLRNDSWKWIKNCPCDFRRNSQGVYLNGTLYWLSWDFIIALDLSTEVYRQLSLPSVCAGPMVDLDMYLDVLGGCLVLSCDYWIKRLDGWMMKDDGGNISWSKLFSFEKMDIIGAYGTLRPITYSKINRHVLFQHHYDLFWFDTDNNCAKKIRINGLNDSFCCQIWSPSLFRLENYVCSGEGVSAKPMKGVKKKRAIKRLKLDVTITESWDRSDSNYSSYSSSEGEYY